MDLFDPQGRRLYLTEDERAVRTLCLTLHYTGCRVSESLALTPRRVDLSGKVIVFETLKKRRSGVYRAVPVPGDMCWIPSTWCTGSGRPRSAHRP